MLNKHKIVKKNECFWCVAKIKILFCEDNSHVVQKNLLFSSNDDPG